MYVSILRTEMRKAHLLFTLLTTLFRKQASKNLSLWCHKSISLMTYITGKTLVFGKKVLSEKKKQQLKTIIVSEENNKIEDLFENEALAWRKLSACAGGVTDFPL